MRVKFFALKGIIEYYLIEEYKPQQNKNKNNESIPIIIIRIKIGI